MLVASQALAIWGTHVLPAGVAAVFGSDAPLFLALFAWRVLHQPLTRRQVAGASLGVALMIDRRTLEARRPPNWSIRS